MCELLGWERPNGALKTIECRQFLESLHERSVIALPAPRVGRPRGSRTAVKRSAEGEAREPLLGTLRDVTPLSIERVETDADRALWRELVERYHYLGHRVPLGAHLRYLIRIKRPAPQVVGCQSEGPTMNVTTIGIDLAKNVFHVHGNYSTGPRRTQVSTTVP